MIIGLVPSGEVDGGVTLIPLFWLLVSVWLLVLVLCAVAGGCVCGDVASVIVVCELVLASVGVVSSRIVNITRLLRASMNFCCCLACWLIASCRSSLRFRRSSDWLISFNITLCSASGMGVGIVDICAI